MSQKGNLSQLEFAKLITYLNSNKQSGTLRISSENKSKFVLLENGEIMSAYSEFAEDSFRSVIRRMQILPDSQQLDFELETQISDGQFAKKLIEKGYVTEREFLEVLKRQSQDIILSLFEWRTGDFIFYPDQFPDTKTISLKLPFKWVIEHGLERIRLRREIDSRLPIKGIFRSRDEDFRQMQVREHPQPEVRRFFEALAEPSPIRSICAVSMLTEFEVVNLLLRYLEEGRIETYAKTEQQLPDEVKKELAEAEIFFTKSRYWEAWTKLKKILIDFPGHADLQAIYQQYTEKFKQDLHQAISSVDLVPVVQGELDEKVYARFPKDTALGFMLSRIDGNSTVKDLGRLLKIDREKLLITLYLLYKSNIIHFSAQKPADADDLVNRRKTIRGVWEKYQRQNYYEILGLNPEAPQVDIKAAYFRLAKQYHPDARTEDDPEDIREKMDQIFVMIRNAYHTLSDESERRAYDVRIGRTAPDVESDSVKQRTKAQLQFSVGLKSLQSREYRTAMEYFRSAIDLDPYEPRYYAKLAEVCLKNPRWYRAGVLACQKAIQLEPENSIYYSILGTLFKQDGDFIQAEKQFLKVLQLDSENIMARQELVAMGKSIPKNLKEKRPDSQFAPMIKPEKQEKTQS